MASAATSARQVFRASQVMWGIVFIILQSQLSLPGSVRMILLIKTSWQGWAFRWTASTTTKSSGSFPFNLASEFEVDNVEGQGWMHSLGLHFDFGDRCTARSKTTRAWTLWMATRGLLRRRRVCGRLLRVWLGLANFHFQLARPGLSALSATYKFAAEHLDHRAPMWASVRSELRDVLGLIFLVEVDMSAPLCSEVHVGDSSDGGYALMSTQASHADVREALRHRERWRFRYGSEPSPQPQFDAEPLGYAGQTPLAGLGTRTQYGKELTCALDAALQDPLFGGRSGGGGKDRDSRPCHTSVGGLVG